jgi:putative ABC transport system permease protein
MTDLRLAFRIIRKHPGMASLAIVALALGIGLTTTMFSIMNGAVLRGLPFEESDRIYTLARLNQTTTQGDGIEPASLHDFVDWRTRQRSFESLSAFTQTQANVVGPDGTPERYRMVAMTANTLSLLRVRPRLGRDFRPEEERKGADPVVIISDKVWRERFASSPSALGQQLRINGTSTTVIGIMDQKFAFPVIQELWVPLTIDLDPAQRAASRRVAVIGRLGPDQDLDRATAELATIVQQLATEYPDTNKNIGIRIRNYVDTFLSGVREVFATMLLAVMGVLVIACANVANLVLARVADRTREIAVRTAIGASRGRVIRQILVEVAVLALIGAAGGLAIARVGIEFFNRAIADTSPPFWIDIRIDPIVLVFVAGMSILAAIAAGLIPAVRASRTNLAAIMNDEGRSTGLRIGRLSRGLVVIEIALSFALLVVSGLAIQSILNVSNVDFGFPMADVWSGRVQLTDTDYPDDERQWRLQEEVLPRVQALPGVVSAALATAVAPGAPGTLIKLPGKTYANEREMPQARQVVITPDYFKVLRTGSVKGRVFDTRDRPKADLTALVNESFERKFFPDGAIGKQFALGSEKEERWRTIVGVVPDLGFGRSNRGEMPEGYYLSMAQQPPSAFAIVVHAAAGDPLQLTAPIRDAVRSVDSNLPVSEVATLLQAKNQNTWAFRVFGMLFMAFGLAALFLATVGLYGVMAFSVTKRTQEIGVRMAIGAGSRDVLRLMLRQGLWQVVLGMSIGVGLAYLLAKALMTGPGLFFDVTAGEPRIFAVIAVVLGVTGLLACLIPARRASRVDPMVALRYQ